MGVCGCDMGATESEEEREEERKCGGRVFIHDADLPICAGATWQPLVACCCATVGDEKR